MGSIFISYARNDDELFVKRLRHDLQENGFDVWWDRESIESRGLTFLQEIRDAIGNADRLIAVVGPSAVTSDYVRAEWEHALLFCKAVVPILRLGHYELLPAELAQFHCPDFRPERPYSESFQELVRILQTPVASLGIFRTEVPALPPHFLALRDEIDRLHEAVLADVIHPTVITSSKQTTILQGMGGIGKTVLAAAFARSADTRRACPDGIIWLRVGLEPQLLGILRRMGIALGDQSEAYVDVETGTVRLSQLLSEKQCLIVLDDVWDISVPTVVLNVIGPRCRLLITTRDGSLATSVGANEHQLDVLAPHRALQLLADWVGVEPGALPPEAVDVARECGYLPFALALCGAMVRDNVPWPDLLQAFGEADLTFIEARFPNYPYPNLLKTLQVSVDALAREDPDEAKRYLEMAVFPPDESIPEAAVLTLWSESGHLNERDARKLVSLLDRKALLQLHGQAPNRRITFHDLHHDYLRMTQSGAVELHGSMVAAYQRKSPAGWSTGPNDGYFFEHLAYHLASSGQKEQLGTLLLDYTWLTAKLEATHVDSLLSDYQYLPGAEPHSLVKDALRLSSQTLRRDKGQFSGQLLARLMSTSSSAIRHLSEHARTSTKKPYLVPLTPTLKMASDPLVAMVKTGLLTSIFVFDHERKAITGTGDGQLLLWDLHDLRLRKGVKQPGGCVFAVAVCESRRIILSGSYDGSLSIWDLNLEEQKARLLPDDLSGLENIEALAVDPRGQYVITASDRGVLRFWDLETLRWTQSLPTNGYSLYEISFTSDGSQFISASLDGVLRLWDAPQRRCVRELQTDSALKSMASTPDGQVAVCGYDFGDVSICHFPEGRLDTHHEAHQGAVWAATTSADGRLAATGSVDGTIRVWELDQGRSERVYEVENGRIRGLAFLDQGKVLASLSDDASLRLWDLLRPTTGRRPERHHREVLKIVLLADHTRAVSTSMDGDLKVWDVGTGECLGTVEEVPGRGPVIGERCDVVATQKGDVISIRNNGIRLWDVSSSKCLWEFDSYSLIDAGAYLARSGAFSGDGCRLVIGTNGGQILLWDLTKKKNHAYKIGEHNASGNARVNSVALFGNDEFAISASEDYTLGIWDIAKRCRVHTLSGHTHYVHSVVVLPGDREAVSGSSDGTLRVWSLETGKCTEVIDTNSGAVLSVCNFAQGRQVITGSSDRSVRVWNLDAGHAEASFYVDNSVTACAVLGDDRVIAGDSGGYMHFFQLVK